MADRAGEPVRAFISVGSNIDPARNIVRALKLLARRVDVCGISTFHRTEPIGPAGQPPFVNGVCCIRTDMPPGALKYEVLRAVEVATGRLRTADPYAPRPIDLDLVLYGETIVDESELSRPFVLAGLAELEPNLRLPGESELVSCTHPSPEQAGMTPMPELTRELIESVIS